MVAISDFLYLVLCSKWLGFRRLLFKNEVIFIMMTSNNAEKALYTVENCLVLFPSNPYSLHNAVENVNIFQKAFTFF